MTTQAHHLEAQAMIAEAEGFAGTAAALYQIARGEWRKMRDALRPPPIVALPSGTSLAEADAIDESWRLAWEQWHADSELLAERISRCAEAAARVGVRVRMEELEEEMGLGLYAVPAGSEGLRGHARG